jgi:hypothetical protein
MGGREQTEESVRRRIDTPAGCSGNRNEQEKSTEKEET